MSSVGDTINTNGKAWTFGHGVCDHFDTHVKKSIPHYVEGHQLIRRISDFFLKDATLCYDLGCATGQLLSMLSEHHKAGDVRFVGIDKEPEMIEKATQNCATNSSITLLNDDIVCAPIEKAELIICYYTMQFITPKFRQDLINRIYEHLHWGGAFILFEKVRAPDARFQDMMTTIYHDMKLSQGYQPAEIMEKTQSLKGVLEPFSSQGNSDLMKRAGFSDIMSIYKYVCFEGFLAIK